MLLRDGIRERLSQLAPRQLTSGYKREAAVLMPIFEREGMPYFLLTRRTDEVETHKGQIAFPGGMREDDENLERTALRETFEEVGIEEKQIEVLGRFHDYLSITEFRVVPFVGFIETPFTTSPHPREVAEILQVPFRVFTNPHHLRVERMARAGKSMDVYFYTHNAHEIWGLTARIIKDFLEVAGVGPQSTQSGGLPP